MKAANPGKRSAVVRRAEKNVDPLQPAARSMQTVERQLRKQLSEIEREVQRIEAAKVVSQEALNFKFSY